MDRRDFLKKVAKLVGTSAAGISLTKLQIATVATGLSGAIGCARNPVGDDPLNKDGNSLLAPCSVQYICDNIINTCKQRDYVCIDEEFLCQASLSFLCNTSSFECSSKFQCSSIQPFECKEYSITHQGSVTIG